MLTLAQVGMGRQEGHPPDGSGAEGGGGAGGDVRVVLGVQLVIDGILRAESHRPGVSQAQPRAPQPLCRAVPRIPLLRGSGEVLSWRFQPWDPPAAPGTHWQCVTQGHLGQLAELLLPWAGPSALG